MFHPWSAAGIPGAFQELLVLLHVHHGLKVTALDGYRLRLEIHIDPVSLRPDGNGKNGVVGELQPRTPVVLEATLGDHRLSNEEWAERENAVGHLCACGCGGRILVRPDMRAATVGIPKFIHGHHKMNMTAFVETLNADGYLTVSQAAVGLGIGENTLRRAEGKGWIKPEWKPWGGREAMRVYKKANLPGLKDKLKGIGFGFRGDPDVLTTRYEQELVRVF